MTKITDENDNLVEVEDEDKEWTKTPGGFCKIDVDLDPDIITDLVNYWARNNLNAASLEQYEEMLESTDQALALHAAVLNDMIIVSLTEQIERSEAALDDTTDV